LSTSCACTAPAASVAAATKAAIVIFIADPPVDGFYGLTITGPARLTPGGPGSSRI
jgi:hypothetical protein